MKNKADYVRSILDPRGTLGFSKLPTSPGKPKLELDLHEMGQLHKRFVQAYRAAERANELASQAHRHADEAMGAAYSSLYWLEAEMMSLEEKQGLGKTSDYVTLDEEVEGA